MIKKTFYTEVAYIVGLSILALGAAFMEKADFGVSMIVAPAYILHLKISETFAFFSFGMAEYTLQACLLICLSILMHKVKLSYFFSLLTAILYGFLLDMFMSIIAYINFSGLLASFIFYIIGVLFCTAGVAFLFKTYLSPEAYEMFVKELSAKYHIDLYIFKTIYDCSSCLISIVLSFIFFGFGEFEGIKWGTIVCAFINGYLIRMFSKFYEKKWEFKDRSKLKRYFV